MSPLTLFDLQYQLLVTVVCRGSGLNYKTHYDSEKKSRWQMISVVMVAGH